MARAAGGRATINTAHSDRESFVGSWLFLFPVTYLAHIAEEYSGGFAERAAELTGLAVPHAAFLSANALFWLLMVAAVGFVWRRPSRAPLAVALATIVVINAALHIGGALILAGYSPGLFTALLFWLPLGIVTLARGSRLLSQRSFRSGIFIGVAAHLLVPVVGLGFVLAFGGGWRAG